MVIEIDDKLLIIFTIIIIVLINIATIIVIVDEIVRLFKRIKDKKKDKLLCEKYKMINIDNLTKIIDE